MTKNNRFKGLCAAAVMAVAGLGAQAQELEFSGYFNGLFPVAEFNNTVNVLPQGDFKPIDRTAIAQSASAGIGGSLRVGLWLDIGANHRLLPFAEASLFWNATQSKVRDIYDNNALNQELKATPRIPHYFNIPLQAGLKYRYYLTDIIRPFAEASIGVDVMFVSGNGYRNISYNNIKNFHHYSYKPSGAMSWTVGLGSYLGSNVTAGIYYIDLGSHRMEYTSRSYKGDNSASFTVEKRHIGEIAIRIGFHF